MMDYTPSTKELQDYIGESHYCILSHTYHIPALPNTVGSVVLHSSKVLNHLAKDKLWEMDAILQPLHCITCNRSQVHTQKSMEEESKSFLMLFSTCTFTRIVLNTCELLCFEVCFLADKQHKALKDSTKTVYIAKPTSINS